MGIRINRVDRGRRFLKRYMLSVTPPHAPFTWTSASPLSRRQGEKKLYDFGNHTADIAEAFAAADDEYESKRAS